MHLISKKRRTLLWATVVVIIIGLVTQYKHIIGLFYPINYNSLIIKYSRMYELDPYLVSAIINVESRYDPEAQSHKQAKGLMQITPSTGKWAAGKIGIKNFDEDMLFDAETNIKIGCWYLNNLKQEFAAENSETRIVLILAAYNGGIGNVKKWLKNKRYSQTGTTLDQIPFKETHQYVEKVLKNKKIYEWLYPGM